MLHDNGKAGSAYDYSAPRITLSLSLLKIVHGPRFSISTRDKREGGNRWGGGKERGIASRSG